VAKCCICGGENRDAGYVLMIRRDGSEAEMCSACAELINQLEDEKGKMEAVKKLKKYNLEIGDYEVRRFLDGVISSCDDFESFSEYVEESRKYKKGTKGQKKVDVHRFVRPCALILLVAVALFGIMHAVMDITSGALAAGIADIVLTAIIDGALLVILIAVMDSLDDVRIMRRRMK